MGPLATFLALSLVLGPATAAGDCKDCLPETLCSAHAETQREALEQYRTELEVEDPARRATAVREIARTTTDHQNAPSREVAEIVVQALRKDPSLEVRRAAVKWIASQDPELVVPAVAMTVDELRAGLVGGDLVPRLLGKDAAAETFEAMAFAEEVLEVAGDLPDDRCVKALLACVKQLPEEMLGQPIHLAACKSLLDLGTYDAVELVVDELKPFRDTPEVRRVHSLLEGLSLWHELDDAPPFDEHCRDEWRGWLRRHKKLFPRSRGRYTLETRQ